MMRPKLLVVALVPCLLSSAAQAQIASGTSGRSTLSYLSGRLVWEELAEFGKCYASFSRNDAVRLVSTPAGSADEAKTYRSLFQKPYQSCLGNVTELRVPPGMVRGSIAQGLYLKRVAVPPGLLVQRTPDLAEVHSLSDAALCYVGGQRAEAQRLIENTKAGSRAEEEAFESVWPNFSRCLPANAAGVKFDLMLIRFRIAEALWRMGAFPPAAQAGTR